MRASVFVGASVDGFIARQNGELDFLSPGGDVDHGYDAFIATVDVLVWGRKTFETVLGFGGAWPFKKPVFVLSSRELSTHPNGANIERISGEPREIMQSLTERGYESAYIDGGETVQRFLRAGCIDRLIVSRVPVLVGSGIPLFGSLPHDIVLTHVATKHFPTGLVQSEYSVGKPATKTS